MKNRSGFSMMELLIYIVAVGVLAAITIPALMGYLKRSKISATKTTLANVKQAITTYYMDTNKYPNDLEDLMKKPENVKGWLEPYLEGEDVPEDGFKNPLFYRPTPGAKHPYDLYSYGVDGPEGDENGYINVWDSK